VAYTVISPYQIGNTWPTSYGGSGTFGVYCDQNFVADDGKSFIAGTGQNLNGEFLTKAAITVVSGVATIASFSLPKTDLGNSSSVRYYGRIFDAYGTPRDYEFESFHLRASLGDSINFQAWQNSNRVPIYPQPDGGPTTTQMNVAIAAAINAPASTTQKGIVKVSVTPVDTANPIAIGDNDSRATDISNATFAATPLTLVKRNANAAATVFDLGGQVYNVKAYGAVGDGVADDTIAIQAALTAANATGGTLFFPPCASSYLVGTVTANSYIFLVTRPLHILGSGLLSKVRVKSTTPTTTDVFRIEPSVSVTGAQIGLRIERMWMEAQGGSATARDMIAFGDINPRTHNNVWIVDNVIGPTSGYSIALRYTNYADSFANNSILHNRLYGGIYLPSAGDSIEIKENMLVGSDSLYTAPAGRIGIDITFASSGETTLSIIGNSVTSLGAALVIRAGGASALNIERNVFETSASGSTGSGGVYVDIAGTAGNPVTGLNFLTNHVGVVAPTTGLNGARLDYSLSAHVGGFFTVADATTGLVITANAVSPRLGKIQKIGASTGVLFTNASATLLVDMVAQQTMPAAGAGQPGNIRVTGNLALDGSAGSVVNAVLNNPDTAQLAQLNLQENAVQVGALNMIGSLFGTTTRRNALELVNLTATGSLDLWTNSTKRAMLSAVGNFKLAGTATRATTEGTNHLDIFDGTAPVGTLANGISLYSTAGELRVMDAAGNATLLSPHDENNEWIFLSCNTVTGKCIRIDMERAMRVLEKLSGEKIIIEWTEDKEKS